MGLSSAINRLHICSVIFILFYFYFFVFSSGAPCEDGTAGCYKGDGRHRGGRGGDQGRDQHAEEVQSPPQHRHVLRRLRQEESARPRRPALGVIEQNKHCVDAHIL